MKDPENPIEFKEAMASRWSSTVLADGRECIVLMGFHGPSEWIDPDEFYKVRLRTAGSVKDSVSLQVREMFGV